MSERTQERSGTGAPGTTAAPGWVAWRALALGAAVGMGLLSGGQGGCAAPEAPGALGPAWEGDVASGDGEVRDAAASGLGGALWVVDAADVPAGVLVRRGGDDGRTGRAIYDLVTVYDPGSGLFFDLTMTDGQVRYPATTYFRDAHCQEPVGVSAGACGTCVAGYGVGLLHAGVWWRVVGGSPVGQIAMGSTRAAGISETCVAHGTSSAKGYPVALVEPSTPPTSFTPPLRFLWRGAR